MPVAILLTGSILIVLGFYAFHRLPGVKLKYVRLLIIAGSLIVLAGVLVLLFSPGKGILMSGSKADSGNDDVSGFDSEGAGAEDGKDFVIIDGSSILIGGKVFNTVEELKEYIKTDGRKEGYRLIDRYALYESYEEVKAVLRDENIPVLSEESIE